MMFAIYCLLFIVYCLLFLFAVYGYMFMLLDSVRALCGLVSTRFVKGALVRVPWHPLMTWEHCEDPNEPKSDVQYEDAPMRHLAIVAEVDKEQRKVLCVEAYDGAERDGANLKDILANIIEANKSWDAGVGHSMRTAWFAMEDCETYRGTADCVTFAEGDNVGLRIDYLPYVGHELDVGKNPRFTMNQRYHGEFIVY